MPIKNYINDFLVTWAKNKNVPEIYNEFSFQFELGKYLSEKMPNCKIQFERNISDFFINEHSYINSDDLIADKATIKNNFYKKEVDMVIFKGNSPLEAEEKYAIELKYIMPPDPTTDKMYGMLEDIAFVQQLRNNQNFNKVNLTGARNRYSKIISKKEFDGCFAITLCNIPRFYSLTRQSKKGNCLYYESTNAVGRYWIFRETVNNKCVELNIAGDYEKSQGVRRHVKPFKSQWVDLCFNNYKYYIVEV